MNKLIRKFGMMLVGAAVFAGSFNWDGQFGSSIEASFVSPAQARIGRPLTPLSYAGVARRTTRRVVAASAVVAKPVVVAPVAVVVVPPPCVEVVDAYGVVTQRCQ